MMGARATSPAFLVPGRMRLQENETGSAEIWGIRDGTWGCRRTRAGEGAPALGLPLGHSSPSPALADFPRSQSGPRASGKSARTEAETLASRAQRQGWAGGGKGRRGEEG